ncbi:MAG TPA: metalloregulator ArsR/SmtB family transcription factor [Bacteroidales bacterium]|nr:metalloregulator ArsR/SmtB family transcription factor [Bacteroidales bacterium]HPS26780.1 metalloregulator ArsR/SmtB family transcription factor [Bacteroidales bacterium]
MIKNLKSIYDEQQSLDLELLEEAANRIKIIAHPIRLAILIMIASKKEMTVTEIYETLSLQQAAVSNHLKMMKIHDLLHSRRDGKNTYYFLNIQSMKDLYGLLSLEN